MKTIFKPLGLAAAVAAVTAGFSGVANAQVATRAAGDLGDMAIIPYYTVQDDWVTGVHIINTSASTQVVKLRLRRAMDSADALDFNLIMSPHDEWTGFIDDSSGNIVFATDDTTCTAPRRADGRFAMPAIFRTGAEEGYIEVVSMGATADESYPIAVAAKHAAGVPADCAAVASNFFSGGSIAAKGVESNTRSWQTVANTAAFAVCSAAAGPGLCASDFVDGGNPLKVSYFFRDATSGVEFGGSAVHIADFSNNEAWMSNQQFGLNTGDTTGFDYPNLNGGPLGYAAQRGLFNDLRDASLLGVSTLMNDWSIATARGVSTDWVVTMPGQYTMFDYNVWNDLAGNNPANCNKAATAVPQCDFRDIPVVAELTLYNREEGVVVPEEGELVISPAPPGVTNALIFPNEVNVVEWTDGVNTPVLGSDYKITVDASVLGEFGWASLSVSSTPKAATQGGVASLEANANGQAVCDYNAAAVAVGAPNEQRGGVCEPATGSVPIVGFVAWERSFPANPDANYGRLVDHSFSSAP